MSPRPHNRSPRSRSPSPVRIPIRVRYQLPPSLVPRERRRAVLSRRVLEKLLEEAERRAQRWRAVAFCLAFCVACSQRLSATAARGVCGEEVTYGGYLYGRSGSDGY
eukprot:SAG31_NODE_18073_length_647_cov_10.618613_1_plen_106_part_01